MPVMNGYETMTEIRKRPQLAEMPIIAVTGKVIGGERERCLAAGASDYIPKPVDTAELLTALNQWFPQDVEAPEPVLVNLEAPILIVDDNAGKRMSIRRDPGPARPDRRSRPTRARTLCMR